jgi:hypothetical protein
MNAMQKASFELAKYLTNEAVQRNDMTENYVSKTLETFYNRYHIMPSERQHWLAVKDVCKRNNIATDIAHLYR